MVYEILYQSKQAIFLKQYKKLDSQTKNRINITLTELSNSENPSEFGVCKPSMRGIWTQC